MTSIEDIKMDGETVGIDPTSTDIPEVEKPKFKFDFLTETGEGSVEEYKDHILNFNKSKWLARILRGMTGIFGSLNYALLDIVIGIFEGLNERKKMGGEVIGNNKAN